MSHISFRLSEPSFRTLSLQEAYSYRDELDKTTNLFEKIAHVLQLPEGIHTCSTLQQEIKIVTFRGGLLGGLNFGNLLSAVAAEKKSQEKQIGVKIWATLFGKDPSASKDVNTEALSNFEKSLGQVQSDQKDAFQEFLKKVNERLGQAVQEKDEDYTKTLLDGLFSFFQKESQKYTDICKAIKEQPISHSDTVKNTVTNTAVNSGSGIQNFGAMQVAGNITTGNTTHVGTQNNN